MKQKIHVEQAEPSPFSVSVHRPAFSARETSPGWRLLCLTMTLFVLLGSSEAWAQNDDAEADEQTEAAFFRPAVAKSMSERQQSLHTRLLEAETSTDVQLVRVEPNQLLSKATVRFNLTESVGIRLERGSMQRRGADDYTWIGQTDLLNNAVLVVRNGQVTGSIRRDGQLYSIKPLTGGLHALVTVDEATFPGDHPSMFDDHLHEDIEPRHRGSSTSSPDTRSTSSARGRSLPAEIPSASAEPTSTSQTLDVIVAYTPQASADVADMQAYIQLAVDETNLSYANSGIETRIALVHLYETTTNSTDDMFVELEQFRTPGDGAFDEIHDLRETYGADIAKLIGAASSNYSYCGLASVIEARTAADAFAITAHDCATGTYTFGHEIGHLQGARHNRGVDSYLFPYAFGHGTTNIAADFHTVMAYSDRACSGGFCPGIPYWSSPSADASYNDIITGDETYRDNASVIDLTAPHLATFAGPQPTAQPEFATRPSIERVITPGQTATEIVTITNPGDQDLYWRAIPSGEIKTSDDPDGPAFEWTDISQSPTATNLGTTGFSEIELPFAFPFYEDTYTNAVVGFNGVIYFEDLPTGIYDPAFNRNSMIPNRFGRHAFIAPYWTTFWPDTGGEVFTDTDDEGRLIIQWHRVRMYRAEPEYTFQAILSPDGSVRFQYHTIPDPPRGVSVGLENQAGTSGVRAAFLRGYLSDTYEEALPTDGMAISITNYDVVSTLDYEGRVEPGASVDLPLTLNPGGKVDGTFAQELTFTTNEPGIPSHTVPINLSIEPMPNRALTLDGTADYMTANAVSDTIAASSAFTLEAWVLPTGGTGQQGLTTFHTDVGNNRNLLVYRDGQFQYYDDNTGYVPSRNEFPVDRWVHVAVTVDASDQGTLYVNGRREATFTTSVRPESGGLFSIGQEWDTGPTASDFFEGRVDEVRIWSQARTQAQLQQGMTTSLGEVNTLGGAFDLSELVAYYRFEGNTLDETSSFNGIAEGTPTYTDDVAQAAAEDRLIVRVNAAVSSGTGNGTSWANAHASLQDGLDGTGPENEVWIAEGTYTPSFRLDDTEARTATFYVTGEQDGVEIYGGFAGTETTRSDRDPSANETILSGDLDGNDGPDDDGDGIPDSNRDENAYNVLVFDAGDGTNADVAANVTTATVLNGVTVTGGNADDFVLGSDGGGLLCDGEGSGNACSPWIIGVTFTGNSARGGGGAIHNAGGDGGTSSPVIIGSTFAGNMALLGGAISNAGNGGESNPVISTSTFIGNTAIEFGGAIHNGASRPEINGVIFTGNTALNGGAIYNINSESRSQITNTILWGNTADGSGNEIYNTFSGSVVLAHTLIQGGLAGISENNGASTIDEGNNFDADPLFADADDPSGPDNVFGTADDGLRLTGGSPALDAGTNDALPVDTFDLDGDGDISESIPFDITGAERIRDNDGDASTPAVVDLGAYEAPDDTQLPVELAGFEATASRETVTLSWRTLTETNNAGFDIERREGETGAWTTLQRVSGAGTTTDAQTYRFEDTALPYAADALTYRLRQVDVDGDESLSGEVTVRRSLNGIELLGTYPNPARQQATVRFGVPKGTDDARLVLYDLLGRAVQQVRIDDAGRQTVTLHTGGLASGVYFLRLTGDGQIRTQKLIVVR